MPAEDAPRSKAPVRDVVVVGASAGGVQVLLDLAASLPGRFPAWLGDGKLLLAACVIASTGTGKWAGLDACLVRRVEVESEVTAPVS